MSNTLLNSMKAVSNYAFTENGALTHRSTMNDLLDLFAMGAAYRTRSDEDCILLFKKAYDYDPNYALKCLFYIGDCRGGQGERRFFRVIMKWLAQNHTEIARRNLQYVPFYRRWDDLYTFEGTKLEKDAFSIMRHQLALDLSCKTPSLLAKWLKSENASSYETARLANITRTYFGMTHKQYRKTLSFLREKINIVERLMSENRWDEIEFDKIPSRAGLIYKNAFARRDIIKAKYEKFAKDENTTVNAGALYPYEVVEKAITAGCGYSVDRAMVNKYWANLTDYFNGASLNALAMIDTSGSMRGIPIDVAISLGMYCAERANGPFANHYISFSSRPQLIECEGIDFVDKVRRIYETNLCENTNIESAFDMILNTAIKNKVPQNAMPDTIIVVSDMEFDSAQGSWNMRDKYHSNTLNKNTADTVMETIANKWISYGYKLPHLIYWNVDARQDNIPMIGNGRISYVSGFSPSIFQTIMTGKTGLDLMFEKLNSPRYEYIR